MATAAQVAERGMGRMRGGSDEKGVGRLRGGSDEKGRGSPVPTALAGRLRGESDEKRRPGGVRLVQSEPSESEESDEGLETGIGRARTRT